MDKRQLGLTLPVKRSLLYNQSDSDDSESDTSGNCILATDNNNSKTSFTNQMNTDGNFGHEPNCSEETPPLTPITTVIENFDSTESQPRKSAYLPMAVKRGPSPEINFEENAAETSRLRKELGYQFRANEQLQLLQEENKGLESKNILMLNEIEALRKQLESKNNLMPMEFEELLKDSKAKNAELLTLTAKTEDLEEQNKHTCFKLGQKDAEIVTLIEKIDELEQRYDSLYQQRQENVSVVLSYTESVEICIELERPELEAELQTKSEEISNLQVENAELKQQCLSLEQKFIELYNSLTTKMKDLNDRVSKRMALLSAGLADINKKKQQLQLKEDATV